MSDEKANGLDSKRLDEKNFGERDSFPQRPPPLTRARTETNMGPWLAQIESNPGASILAYCFSSISMTVVNKYVVSGSSWNLNFLYLAIQVCYPYRVEISEMSV